MGADSAPANRTGSAAAAAAIGGLAGASLAAHRGRRAAVAGAAVGAVALAVSDTVARARQRPHEIPATYRQDEAPLVVQAADYVAGMTDRFALATHDRLVRPNLDP